MLKSAIGTILAAVLTTPVISMTAAQATAANQWIEVSTPNLVMTTSIPNANLALPTNTSEAKTQVPKAGIILGLAAVGSIAVVGVLSIGKAKKTSKAGSSSSSKSKENTIRLEQANHKIQKKLLKLLHGDRDAALRLLSQVKSKNYDRSIDWCAEKVIFDLERDRGRY